MAFLNFQNFGNSIKLQSFVIRLPLLYPFPPTPPKKINKTSSQKMAALRRARLENTA